jgi:tyrosinase
MSLNLRKSVTSIEQDETEWNKLRSAFSISMGISDNRGYNHIAGFHGVPDWYCWHQQRALRTTVRARLFLPWHRAYLYWLEIYLKELAGDPTVTIPYWDWSSEESRLVGIPKAYSQKTVNRQPNPLFKFNINIPSAGINNQDTVRDSGLPDELPTVQDVNFIRSLSDFEDFENQLEDVHDGIHGWVGGSMSSVAIAAFDPIFWAHHCMIDRIWYLWQIDRGESRGFEQMLDIPLAPFPLNVNDVLNIRRLGYEYAGNETSVSVS